LLEAATEALAQLDAGALGELERRALELKALLTWDPTSLPHVQAGYRVFAAVVRATGENLGVLERSTGAHGIARSRSPWGR
jgi:hypothetical protein